MEPLGLDSPASCPQFDPLAFPIPPLSPPWQDADPWKSLEGSDDFCEPLFGELANWLENDILDEPFDVNNDINDIIKEKIFYENEPLKENNVFLDHSYTQIESNINKPVIKPCEEKVKLIKVKNYHKNNLRALDVKVRLLIWISIVRIFCSTTL